MIMTFDFVFMAQRDNILWKRIEHAILNQEDEVIYTNIQKLYFCASKQSLIVSARSANSLFAHKIPSKEIKYSAVMKMLNNNWDSICKNEIIDIV